MSGMGRGRGGIGPGVDADAQRALNADAPRVDGLLRRIIALFAPHRRAIIVTMVLVVVAAALSVIPPLLTAEAFDVGLFPATGGPNIPALIEIVLLMVSIVVVSTLLGVWQTYLTSRVGNSVMGALRVRLFTHLQSMELGFFTRTKTGVIQSRLQNDVGGVSSVLSNTISSILANTVTVIAALVAMLLLSWQLTIVAVILMPFLVIAQRRVGQVRARIATKTQESLSDMTAITQETLSVSGILLAKSFNRQDAEIARYSAENNNQVRLQVSQQMSGQWFFALVGIILASIPAIVYLISGWLITGGATDISAGTIVAFTTVQARLLFPLLALMRVGLDLQTSGALFARIFEYLDLKPAVVDPPDAQDAPSLADLPAGQPAIQFRDVTFRYPDQAPDERPTLDSVSFDVPKGQFVAFVGPSGAGKTTVSSLIPRFYVADGGSVQFAGVDVRSLRAQTLLDQLGIVSQDTYLFHATIAENLRYAKPDATFDELVQAATKANIHERIVSFPGGYDTVVGERGFRLSGGEKQRIAIARVLLKDPPVLILDEATSALDTVSERVVQGALDSAAAGRTTVAIAHRLSTIAGADVIYVLVDGAIAERGTHAELVQEGGVYAALYAEQVLTGASGVTSGPPPSARR